MPDPYSNPDTASAYQGGYDQGITDEADQVTWPSTTPYGDPMRDRSGYSPGDREYLRTSLADAWWDGYKRGRRGDA